MRATTGSQKVVAYIFTLIVGSALLFYSNEGFAKSTGTGWLGVAITELTPSLSRDLGLKDQSGLLIENIYDESPAEKGGLLEKDVILTFNGKPVQYVEDLISMVRNTAPGTKVKIGLFRDGKTIIKKIEIAEKKSIHQDYSDVVKKRIIIAHGRPYLGVHIQDIDENLAEYFHVEEHKGVLITEVVEDSPADKAGLKSGDVIVKIGGEPIHYTEDIHYSMKKYNDGDKVPVEIIRKAETKTVEVTLDIDEPIEIRIKKHGRDHRYDLDFDHLKDIHIDIEDIEIDVDHIIESMENSLEKLFDEIGI